MEINKGNIKIYLQDCYDFLETLENESIKAFIFDPPYGVLTGHKIETVIDIPKLFNLIHQKLRKDGFVAFFGQMPTVLDWLFEIRKKFLFSDHISWCKRSITSPYLPIQRSHEEIFIYKKSQKAKYVETQEKYEDLKTPAMHLGLYELSTYKTTISDLQRRLTDRKYDELYYSGLPTGNGSQNGKNNDSFYLDAMKNRNSKKNDNDLEKMLKEQKIKYGTEGKRNDSKHQEMFAKKNSQESKQKHVKENRDLMKTNSPEYYGKKYPTKQNPNDNIYSEGEYGRAANSDSFRYRSKWFCNLTNTWSFLDDSQDNITELISTVWSYLSQNQTTFGKNGENWKHPTVKPVLLVNRLVKLLTEENDLVCDIFLGSGTTMVSCIQTNRKFIGCELQEQYFKICEERKYLEFKNKSELLF